MKKHLIKQALNTQAPYVGRGRPVQPTSQQLELIKTWEAIDERFNRVWETGKPHTPSNTAEEVRRMVYEPDS